jgi:hypothetical protein
MIFQIWNSKRYDENMKVKGREMVAFDRLCWCFRVQQRSSGRTFDWGKFPRDITDRSGLASHDPNHICNSSSCTTLFIPANHFNCRIHSNI